MKLTLASSLFLIVSSSSYAANITAVQNGDWTSASTWDLNRVPADGDRVIIPVGKTVMFINVPYPQTNPPLRPTLDIRIYGSLDFSSPGNDKLYLDVGSQIQIYSGGTLMTTTSSIEIIAIYNGSTDNTVWTGTPSIINGPASATSTSSGFTNALLPVTLRSFTFETDGKCAAILKWVTSEEVRSCYFDIEMLNSAYGQWSSAGIVAAAGSSNTPKDYEFHVSLVKGQNQFRLKLVDTDGRYKYSQIIIISGDADAQPVLTYNYSAKQLIFGNLGGKEADLAIFNASGSIVVKEKVSTNYPFAPSTPGVYLVRLKVGRNYVTTKLFVN